MKIESGSELAIAIGKVITAAKAAVEDSGVVNDSMFALNEALKNLAHEAKIAMLVDDLMALKSDAPEEVSP